MSAAESGSLVGTRGRILEELAIAPRTARDLAKTLGIQESAARGHLDRMEERGLVVPSFRREGVGRPRKRYLLTGQGQDLFPKSYDLILDAVVDELLASEGEGFVSALFAESARRMAGAIAKEIPKAATTDEKARRLVAALNDLGFRCSLEKTAGRTRPNRSDELHLPPQRAQPPVPPLRRVRQEPHRGAPRRGRSGPRRLDRPRGDAVYASDPAPVVRVPSSARAQGRNPAVDDPLLSSVGGTPLLPLRRLSEVACGEFELWAKAEFLNPTGSVKDRAALEIVRDAFDVGQLGPGRVLLDASSGNTAVAYAMLGARLGFEVELCLPRNASPERVARIRRTGPIVVFTDPAEGTDGAQREARRRSLADPQRYFYGDQLQQSLESPDAHYRHTGPEIWNRTSGRITDLVVGVGTGGTISGTGRFLKERRPGFGWSASSRRVRSMGSRV